MAHGKMKPNGGSGGKRGHSNMTHWSYTSEVKLAARKARRGEDKEFSLRDVAVSDDEILAWGDALPRYEGPDDMVDIDI